ncbi:MAG: hypothetical protein AAF224_14080 [Pseudomonadota bacterium]
MGPKFTISRYALIAGLMATSAVTNAVAQTNGIGPDPDGDSNPATDVYGFYQQTADAAPEIDPLFNVINFEPPPGKHNDVVRAQYKSGFGVSFSRGLRLQKCDGQRYFEYNTRCIYEAPASGKYAAVYHDDQRRPLRMRFDQSVCAAALSIYPVGGREGENFTVTLDLYRTEGTGDDRLDKKINSAKVDFTWTKNTFRWRSKVIAFLEDKAADRVDVSIRSKDKGRTKNNVDFLIDDLAYVAYPSTASESPCAGVLASMMAASDYKPGGAADASE